MSSAHPSRDPHPTSSALRPGVATSTSGTRVGQRAAPLLAAIAALLVSPLAMAENPTATVSGGSAEQRQNIENQLGLARRSCELPEFRERSLLADIEDRARRSMRAFGHYNAEITTTLERDGTCYRIDVVLDPGPQTTLGTVDIRYEGPGAETPALRAFLATPGLNSGDALRHDRYDALRGRMQRTATEQGFLAGRWVERALRVDPENNQADVVLVYDTGERFRFGEANLQQDILREAFVMRLVPFEVGDVYSTRQLLRLQRNLDASGYFESVRVRPNLDAADGEFRVPVDVEIVPRKRYAYEAGIGFSTDAGARVRLGVENRYFNRRGHRYNADLEFSERRSGIAGRYQIPLGDPLSERIEFDASFRTENTDTQESDRFRVGASRVRVRPSGWTVTEGLRYENERFTIADATQRTNFLIGSYQLARTRSDDDLFPQRGYRVSLLGQGASESLGSSTTFLQGVARGKYIQPLGPGRLIARGDAATTLTSDVEDLPSSLRFFAGGDTSLRGYRFEELGPTNADGNVIGGRHLLVGSAEYDHPIGQSFGAAAFVDFGNAFDQFDDIDPQFGIGVGARWRSPVGPLRLDVARGTNADDNFRIHFTMGPDL